jgi:aryl-alcohol dehydrogenase-like predicted oxidoreductase
MNYTYMGRTGLKVSELCLGAMTFGREATEEVSHAMLKGFVEAGGTFIDTANVYGRGLSEEIVGRWLKGQKRDDLIIATKVFGKMGEGLNDEGLSRKHILSSVEASLRRLQTDYIDLYQIHVWDYGTPIEETLSTLQTLVERGLVRYIGASNVSGWQLQKTIEASKHRGWETLACLQPLYNLLARHTEWELLPVCENEGLGVIPWSPLRGGWLSGKYKRGMTAPPENTRIKTAEEEGWSESWSNIATEHTFMVIDTLLGVAKDVNKTPAQVALNWLLSRPVVTAPIIGVRTLAQLEDNLGSTGWRLSQEHLKQLDKASAIALLSPYDFLESYSGARKHVRQVL